MLTHAETEKLAESGLQKVPAAHLGRENPASTFASLSGQEASSHVAHVAPNAGEALPTLEIPGAMVKEVADAQPVRLARMATEIEEMAVELLHFKADSLSVLIRPDADTALHLRMTVIAGRIYAEARLQSGEGAWLQSAWGDLQRVLADHNIIMEPLKYSSFHPSAGQWGSGGPAERPPQLPPESETPKSSATLTPATATLAPPKRRAPMGWEWWA